jgi:hypothetical protein
LPLWQAAIIVVNLFFLGGNWHPDGIPMFLLDIQNVGFEFSALKYLAKCCTPQLLGSVEA